MVPVIVIIGRPNVGKSTLYNKLTKSRDALVMDRPGVTRDSQYGRGKLGDAAYWIVDTAGIEESLDALDQAVAEAAWHTVAQADSILFMVDATTGLSATDEYLAQRLRQIQKPVVIVVNKVDGHDPHVASAEFHRLGFEHVQGIAANAGRGLQQLMAVTLAPYLPSPELTEQEEDVDFAEAWDDDTSDEALQEEVTEPQVENRPIRLAIIGRPNVGKSTLINRLLGEERVVAFDRPGTTRDSIMIPHDYRGQQFELVDTAGIRRRKNITDKLETFAIIKALQAIEQCNVVLLVIDAQTGIVDKDVALLNTVLEAGKALVICLNKWDGLDQEKKEEIKQDLDRKLRFCDYAKIYFISAKYGTNVGHLLPEAKAAYESAMRVFHTNHLTTLLEQAVTAHAPPRHNGRSVKLRYAHCGGHNPPVVVIHGNQTEALPATYLRYLSHFFRKALNLTGTPLRVICRTGENPYANKRNPLTPRQQYKRDRIVAHRKKSDKKKRNQSAHT
jgi:GTP-binding protein